MASIKSYFGRATFVAWGSTTLDLIDLDDGGITATTEVVDNTRYGDNVRQSLPGYTDPGYVSLTVSTDRHADVTTLRRNFWDHVTNAFDVVLPNGLQLGYIGFISSFKESLDKHGLYTIKLIIKLSGKPTEQPYESYTIVPTNGSNMYRGSSYGLFLVGGSATETVVGGEGAEWGITTEGTHAGTMIVGNTLMISPDEAKNEIAVQATIYPNDEAVVLGTTATYHIKHPAPTTLVINGDSNINVTIGTRKTQQYNIAAYPSGASAAATWTITDDRGRAVAGLSIADGLVTAAENYNPGDPGTYHYVITATSASVSSLKTKKEITITATRGG